MSTTSTNATTSALHPTDSVWTRMRKALGPALPGMVLDLVDALSISRLAGPMASVPVGLIVGMWLSSYYSIALQWRCLIVIGSGLYTLVPGTEAIPLATILTCLGRFLDSSPSNGYQTESPTATDSADERDSETSAPRTAPLPRAHRSEASCPECGSQTLHYGQVGQRFFPRSSSLWSKGHEIQAFVCRECGFVGHYLSRDDLDQLPEPDE